MMKHQFLLSLFILIHVPILGMLNEHETIPCDRCGLGTLVYNVAKQIRRNDFLYLARADSVWFLRKKLQLREHFENRDRYYVRAGRVMNGIDMSVYHTPLHEAIREGNIEIVRLLCAAGADMHKKIKSELEVTKEEVTTESHGAVYMESMNNTDTEIQEFKDAYYIGLSALELATAMRTKSENKPSERAEIECLLMGNDKKD